ncbi:MULTISPECIES: hypothetical protein [Arthrobacter]|uniref:Uncharacterized protein n=2 Tax=Arthrobacter TaxID=1663 RepID=A0ABU9KHH2_9MICC|nr:hypothetical protein [Arthrobacter sp. YJM1]MDP5226634.1 hypothetical protein [Arthrobacter sp. YJM1]
MDITDKSTPWRANVIDPELHSLPPEAEGHALIIAVFEGQHVTVAVAPDVALMALEAIEDDPSEPLKFGAELAGWVTLGWPEEWVTWRRQWAPVYPTVKEHG